MTNFNMFQIVWILLFQIPGAGVLGWWCAENSVPTFVFVQALIVFSILGAFAPFLIRSIAPELF